MIRSAFSTLLTTFVLAGCATRTTEPTSDAVVAAVGTAADSITGRSPAASAIADPAALAGEWRILTLNGAVLPAGAAAEASLNFDTATNKVSGSTGCNRLMGTYAVSGTAITFGPLATTRMACAPNSPEAGLLAVLGSKTLTYQLTDSGLTLLDGSAPVITLSH